MPQSLSNVLVHIVFSTKNREPLITRETEESLHRYLASVCRACKCPTHAVGGNASHVHVLCSLSRTISISQLLEEVKKRSSKWPKTEGGLRSFWWQNGYGAFSIGQSQLAAARDYIARQKERHRDRTFQEEFGEFLRRYCVEYDERYVWD